MKIVDLHGDIFNSGYGSAFYRGRNGFVSSVKESTILNLGRKYVSLE